jgi:hypothetical protein
MYKDDGPSCGGNENNRKNADAGDDAMIKNILRRRKSESLMRLHDGD